MHTDIYRKLQYYIAFYYKSEIIIRYKQVRIIMNINKKHHKSGAFCDRLFYSAEFSYQHVDAVTHEISQGIENQIVNIRQAGVERQLQNFNQQ